MQSLPANALALSAQQSEKHPLAKTWSRAAGASVAVLGFAILFGYTIGTLASETPPATVFNLQACAALGFLCAGISLFLLAPAQARPFSLLIGRIAAGGVFGIATLTLLKYLPGWGEELNGWLLIGDASSGTRGMTPAGAFTGLLTGTSLLFLSAHRPRGAQTFALAALFVAAICFISALYRSPAGLRADTGAQFSFITALAFLLLSAGVLCARPHEGFMSFLIASNAGGGTARRLLPLSILVIPALGWMHIQGEQAGLYDTEFGVALNVTATIAIFAGIIWWNARALHQSVNESREAHREIRRLNAELEQRVAQRTTQLQTAVKELEAFSYSVSHDLRAPLRGIDGYARILLEDYDDHLDEEGRRYLNLVCSHTHQMGQLIDNLLDFSRLNRSELRKSVVDVNLLIEQCRETLDMETEQRRVQWKVEKLPPCWADPALLRQVFMNLLSNALKFTRQRETAIIEIGFRKEAEYSAYYVRDNGAGFDMKYADKLFGAFQRLHRAEEYEGTGIGLATVQRILHRHSGYIWAEAEVDRGATFYFTLPSREASPDEYLA